jgi:hypothetical protein
VMLQILCSSDLTSDYCPSVGGQRHLDAFKKIIAANARSFRVAIRVAPMP